MPTICVPADFDLRSTVRSHGWSTLGPFDTDRTGDTLYVRTKQGLATVRQSGRLLRIGGGGVRAVRACLRLDLDLREFWELARGDPALAWAAKKRAGRLLRAPTAFADAAMVLATTNCSWALTIRLTKILMERWGENGAFPSQERMAMVSERALRGAGWGYRAPYLARLARGAPLEQLRLDTRPTEELRLDLLALPGFGPYAADYMLRLLGRFEHLALDSWVTRVWREKFPRRKQTESAIKRSLHRYGRWKGLAFLLIVTANWYEAKDWKVG